MSALWPETRRARSEDFARLSCELPFTAVRALLDMGVPAATVGALTGAGMLALADVDLLRGGRFALGGPVRRLLLGVTDEAGDLVDVAALSSSCEDEWALLTGEGAMLSAVAWREAQVRESRELRLHPTPFAWLRNGCSGCAVLELGGAALAMLRSLRPFQTIVTDPGAGPVLEKMLAHGGLPLVAEDRAGARRRRAA